MRTPPADRLPVLERIAQDVLAWRRDLRKLPADAPPWDLRDEAEGLWVQQRVAEDSGFATVGWKLGATDAPTRARLGLSQPFVGRVFAPRLLVSPADLGAHLRPGCIIETEIAFRIVSDLPARERPYGLAEVRAAIGAMHAAFEIVDFSRASRAGMRGLDILADNGGCGGLVLGEGTADWERPELLAGGAQIDIGAIGGDPEQAEHPVSAPVEASLDELVDRVLWLAEHLRRHGQTLRAGQWVSTGTLTGMQTLAAGQRARARAGGIGRVEARLP